MKALSIKQPWASLQAIGIKDIENRTWKTNYRGRIYIHASAQKAKGFLGLLTKDQVKDLRSKSDLSFDFPTSAIIGEVDIVDCVVNHPSVWAEKTFYKESEKEGEFYVIDGKPIYNWVLANPVLYEKPIPAKGKLSFWEPCKQTLKLMRKVVC